MERITVRSIQSSSRIVTAFVALFLLLSGFQQSDAQPVTGHCGTEAVIHQLQEAIKAGHPLSTLDLTPQTQDSIISPSGRFKIFFDRTGINAATDAFIRAVAGYADGAYRLEIDTLGNPKPPYSFADSTWHIYLQSQGSSGNYGYTTPVDFQKPFDFSPSGLPLFRAFITIDNAFSNERYTTKDTDAARVTVYHEFQHVIQAGDYGFGQRSSDVNFREMSSVWCEIRSTPWVPDYLQYLPSFLSKTNSLFSHIDPPGCYGAGIFFRYLSGVHGDSVIRNIWQYYSREQNDFLIATDTILQRSGSSFCNDYKDFGAEVFQAVMDGGSRYNKSEPHILPDLNKYPAGVLPISMLPNGGDTSFTLDPAALAYFETTKSGGIGGLVISRNIAISASPDATVSAANGSFQFFSSSPVYFCDTSFERRNNTIAVFPQPFNCTTASEVQILASDKSNKPISSILDIYTTSNVLVKHSEAAPIGFEGSWYHSWDGKDDAGNTVGSGIYYFTVLTDGIRSSGKLALVRK